MLLAGDAAGFADPLTGEGITAAIESGEWAARAILDGAWEPARVAARYERALAGLRRELRIARVLARLLYDLPRARRWLFRTHGQALSEGVTDVLMGERTLTAVVRDPRAYLRLARPR